MKKSIKIFTVVSLLSISASTFAFAGTDTANMLKPETVKMEVSSSTKPMNNGKSAVAKARVIAKKEAMGKPMKKKAVANMMKKTETSTTTRH